MKFRNYLSEGIVLARKNYSEADRILAIFSKEFGRMSLIAKGVRKLKSKKRGHIEIFNRIKFSGTKTRGLDIMTEVEVMDSFNVIRKNLKKVALAYYFCEAVGKVTREGETNREVYDLLFSSLKALEKEKHLKKLRFDFVHELLSVLGFWPRNKSIPDPDYILENVIERKMNSRRVGKRILE